MDEKTLPGSESQAPAKAEADTRQQDPQSIDTSEIESEADKLLSSAPEDLSGEDDDDDQYIRVKKTDLQKFNEGKKNLVEGLKTVKTKVKSIKPVTSAKPAPQPTAGQQDQQSDVVTKKDFYRGNEKKAIKEAEKNKLLSDNWSDVMKHFKSTRGKDTAEDILEDISDAFTVWKSRNPDKVKSAGEDGNRSLLSSLGSDTQRQAGDSSQQGGEAPKKSVLPKRTRAQDWFPSSEKK